MVYFLRWFLRLKRTSSWDRGGGGGGVWWEGIRGEGSVGNGFLGWRLKLGLVFGHCCRCRSESWGEAVCESRWFRQSLVAQVR